MIFHQIHLMACSHLGIDPVAKQGMKGSANTAMAGHFGLPVAQYSRWVRGQQPTMAVLSQALWCWADSGHPPIRVAIDRDGVRAEWEVAP